MKQLCNYALLCGNRQYFISSYVVEKGVVTCGWIHIASGGHSAVMKRHEGNVVLKSFRALAQVLEPHADSPAEDGTRLGRFLEGDGSQRGTEEGRLETQPSIQLH